MGRTKSAEAIPLFDLKPQYAELRAELLEAAERVLDSGRYILGGEGRAFETEFAKIQGTPQCAGVSSGTQALQIGLEALGVGPGDEVALPAFTFIATATAVSELGAKPLFVDVEPDSLNLDPADLRRRLTKKTKAVIPVHLYGRAAEMNGILAVAKERGLKVVEDCAQAHLARYRNDPVGALGDYGAFSFYPSKNLGALGDAGALTTKDPALHQAAVVLRNVGRAPGGQYEHVRVGRNARLDEIQAAFLRVKLKRLASWTAARGRLAKRYLDNLKGLPLRLPPADGDGTQSAWHLFVVQTPKRDALAAHLKKAGISTAVYYPQPLHLQAAYRSLGGKTGDLPESERASAEVLALPLFPELSPEKADRVAEEIRRFFSAA